MSLYEWVAAPLRKMPRLHALLKRIRRRLQPDLVAHLKKALAERERLSFVVVGANDGRTGDPFAKLLCDKPAWRGLFVEPVPHLFARLAENYADRSRFACANVAIGVCSARLPFFYVSQTVPPEVHESLPRFYDQIGSLSREYVVQMLGEKIEPYLIAQEVHCEPIEKVLADHAIGPIDYLQVDVEGYELQVLSGLDFARHGLPMVLFEHSHLSADDLATTESLLTSCGYRLQRFANDTLAFPATRP